jgi:CBS domain-containing protein
MLNIPVREIMTENVVTLSPDAPLLEAHRLMHDGCFRHLPVVDAEGRLVGILTRGDLREAWPSALTAIDKGMNMFLLQQKVSGVMSRRVITIGPDATLEEAARLLLEKKIGGLPVVEADRLVGIVTECDIFKVVAFGEVGLPAKARQPA